MDLQMKFELNKVYCARDGSEWKIICIGNRCIVVVNKEQNRCITLENNGNVYNEDYIQKSNLKDLIELVGNEFT